MPVTSLAETTEPTDDRFYKKGVDFALSKMTGTSSLMEDDDYDAEPATTLPLATPASSVADPSLSVAVTQSGTFNQTVAMMQDSTFDPTKEIGAVMPTANHLSTSRDSLQESQDSGIGSQTPPPDPIEDANSTQQPSLDVSVPVTASTEKSKSDEDSQEPQSETEEELPNNMTLEELYAKVKVLFPSFKPNSILRFSSLLGPGKPSSLPKLWSEAKKPPRRKKQQETVELKLDCDFIPPADMINTDDEVKIDAPVGISVLLLYSLQESFHLPLQTKSESKVKSSGAGTTRAGCVDPETVAWRFGPAKIWYDQIGVAEDGSNLNYGFKLKEVVYMPWSMQCKPESVLLVQATTSPEETEGKIEDGSDLPEDAFLMVTQQHWEDKILWEVPYTPGPAMTGAGQLVL